MKIRKLQLKNIGVFDDAEIEFQPCPAKDKAEIHILTGQNGTGKTTILMALASSFENPTNPHEEELTERNFLDNWSGLLKSADPKNDAERKFLAPLESMLKFMESKIKINQLSTFRGVKSGFNKRFRFFDYSKNKESFKSYAAITFDNSLNSVIYGCLCENIHSFHQDNMLKIYGNYIAEKNLLPNFIFTSVSFAYSGYRRIKDEKIELGKEIEENPLYQSLEFVKDENSKFTVNQWLGRNLSKRALAKEENDDNEANKFDENIKNLEKVIADVVGYEIKFKLKTDLSLVLIKDNQELDFDVLPDGLKSLISWIGDLLMRLDSLKWENDTPIFEREIILFLDEIEVHLHPAWQRKVLPVVQRLFKNSQIFVSTHSPFVVNSVDDAWVYKLKLENGKAKVEEIVESENSNSITQVLREVFEMDKWFGDEVQTKLDKFEQLRDKIISNGASEDDEKELLELAENLSREPSDQLKQIVQRELRQLSDIKGKDFSI